MNEQFDEQVSKVKLRAEENYNNKSKVLLPLAMKTNVRIQNPISKVWDRIGTIVGIGKRRDYFIKLPCGKVLWRNCKFLQATTEGGDGRKE